MPPTAGHKFLIETALKKVDHLTVLVGSVKRLDLIPVDVRREWLERHFSERVTFVSVSGDLLNEAKTFIDQCRRLRSFAIQSVGATPDVIFSSENYGRFLAELFCCTSEIVDQRRSEFSISSTMVRNNPIRYWHYILPEARLSYLREYVVIAPEERVTRVARKVRDRVPHISCISIGDVDEPEFFDYVGRMRLLAKGSMVSVLSARAWGEWAGELWVDPPGGGWGATSIIRFLIGSDAKSGAAYEEEQVLARLTCELEALDTPLELGGRKSGLAQAPQVEKTFRDTMEALLISLACLRIKWLRWRGFSGI
jgi:nicotinamide mononucleotide adenylyltransferase